MLEITPNYNIGTVDLVAPARDYNRYGPTSNVVNINGGRQYNIELKAEGHSGVPDLTPALDKLNAHVAAGCMHDSDARVDAPKCHEETRKAVQENIFSWITSGNMSPTSQPTQEVLWLTGPAGTGKTAIMGTVSDTLEEAGQLAATYYFSSYKGTLETMSKRQFVTTLAYQFAVHPALKDRLSSPILSAVRKNPAIFKMSLKRQLEVLILEPLRSYESDPASAPIPPLSVIIDGVDECGEAGDSSSSRSRQEDQVEVLSLILQAIKDPAFPFRVVVASRPETWIRRFFTNTASGKVSEIFLDDKYSPDDDIRLVLKSKFAEICRRYDLDHSMWPSEEDIAKLVDAASGQFIYAATVLRFIDTPGALPQAQLDIVLKIKPQDRSNPFSALDALYTSILHLSPSPERTVLWLKAIQRLQGVGRPTSSAWTLDGMFESSAGQAKIVLGGLPSLIHIPKANSARTDSQLYGADLKVSSSNIPSVGWSAGYTFYHKSFLDYLEDDSRCGAAFPGIGSDHVNRWLQDRFAQTLMCGGPEVPTHASLLLTFRRCFLDLLVLFDRSARRWKVDDGILSDCDPTVWLSVPAHIPSDCVYQGEVEARLYIFVHNNCRSYCLCNTGCKLWRRAISELPNGRWRGRSGWSSFDLLLDTFNIKRLHR
ncbi:hypothetical protein FA13DRAFT_162232 [Coprinellus micaceus]|uniref:Nephrocystin 3-like N-terminal domain-containing protein n=1 Tax=Coprinellus micaceus TaxID=71717 RepID=A0A4Y7THF1_COPMI|nr:hypothetical protein FA13DRAFT_162232 [Coprinellus micaceus]